jgi:shikimate 5-dehydrogenase
MIHAIIGHRGVGKTSFLNRIKAEYQERMLPCVVFDLDAEIEKRTQKSVSQIFANEGEAAFRNYEQKVFQSLLAENDNRREPLFIAMGAGFQGEIPSWVRVLWLRRPTDADGRIFLDRPRLNQKLSPLDEYFQRFQERDARDRALYDKSLIIGEGWEAPNAFEAALLGLRPEALNTAITVLPEHLQKASRFSSFVNDNLQLGVRFFELRTDLLSEADILRLTSELPKEKILVSFRKANPSAQLISISQKFRTDWDCAHGPSPLPMTDIVSLHHRAPEESIDEAIQRLVTHPAQHYKFAPQIFDWSELWSGHQFYLSDTSKHSFLPCSQQGRWSWYRLLHKKRMFLNFMRDGEGSSPDQPTIFDFLRVPASLAANKSHTAQRLDSMGAVGTHNLAAYEFAAVLGAPVAHSHTPAEQHEFFYKRRMPVFAIEMTEEECQTLNLSILQRMGLRAAAVTSPLKTSMYKLCSQTDRKSQELSAVNTIVSTKTGWSGVNTDITGLKNVFSAMQMPHELAVWGGGGTRRALRELLPFARFFSARRGEEIWVDEQKSASPVQAPSAQPVHSQPMYPQSALPLHSQLDNEQPEVVVWALGRHRFEETKTPPQHWRPQFVFDLNYSENSPGREYAMQVGAKYLSGKSLFKSQAAAQREFWQQAGV